MACIAIDNSTKIIANPGAPADLLRLVTCPDIICWSHRVISFEWFHSTNENWHKFR